MKGKVTIELKDVNTGKVEKIEGENTVTNVLNDIIKFTNGMATANRRATSTSEIGMNYTIMPIATKALGGILLLDDTFSPSSGIKPSNVNVVASAGQKSNTIDFDNGSLVEMESGETEHGYKNVWEFGTGQANGTIKALALTNDVGGHDSFTNGVLRINSENGIMNNDTKYLNYTSSNKLSFVGHNDYLNYIYYDETKQEMYGVTLNTSTKILTLLKYHFPLNKFKVNEYWAVDGQANKHPQPQTVLDFQLTASYSITSSWNGQKIADAAYTDVENLKTWIVIPRSTSSPTTITSVNYVEIDWVKMLVDPTDPTAMVEKTIDNLPVNIYGSGECYGLWLIFRNVFFFSVRESGNQIVYAYDFVNDTYVRTNLSEYISGTCSFRPAGSGVDTEGVWISLVDSTQGKVQFQFNYDGTLKKYQPIMYTREKGIQIHPLLFASHYDSGTVAYHGIIAVNVRYIGTYYQLPTPINKTSNQVMKISYELIDA